METLVIGVNNNFFPMEEISLSKGKSRKKVVHRQAQKSELGSLECWAKKIKEAKATGIEFREKIPDKIGLAALERIEKAVLGHARSEALQIWGQVKAERIQQGLPIEFSIEEREALSYANGKVDKSDEQKEKEEKGKIEATENVKVPYEILKVYWEQKKGTFGLNPSAERYAMRIKLTIYFMAEHLLGINNIPS